MVSQYADLNNPDYVRQLYQSIQQAGSQIGSGWEERMGAPQPAGPPATNLPGALGPGPSPQNLPLTPSNTSSVMPLGGAGPVPFDSPFQQRQTGPNTFMGGYGLPAGWGSQPPQQQPVQPGQWQAPTTPGGSPWMMGGVPQPGLQYGSQPSTYPVASGIAQPPGGGMGFGFPQGPLQQNLLQTLQALGYPELGIARALVSGAPLPPANFAGTAAGLGGIGLASPQSINALGPSGGQYLQGLIETLLGMPFDDYLYGAYQPFQGLGRGKKARTYNPSVGGFQIR